MLVVAIITVIVYSLIHLFRPEKTGDFITEFAAGGLGVLMAFYLDRTIEERQNRAREHEESVNKKRTDLEIQINVLKSIKQEVELHIEPVRDFVMGNQLDSLNTIFTTRALESAIGGGHYSFMAHDTQVILSDLYDQFKSADRYVEKILSMIGSAGMALGGSGNTVLNFKKC